MHSLCPVLSNTSIIGLRVSSKSVLSRVNIWRSDHRTFLGNLVCRYVDHNNLSGEISESFGNSFPNLLVL